MSNVNNPLGAEGQAFPRQSSGTQGTGAQNQSTMERAKETASNLGEKARETASSVAEQARSAGTSAVQQAQSAASYVAQKADDATASVGSGIRSFSDTVRSNLPQGGYVADTLESTGRYLEEEGLSGVAEDLTTLIRRNPIPAMFIGVGIGFLLARAMSSSSRSNY